MKNAIEMGSGAIVCTPSYIDTVPGNRKLFGGICMQHTDTNRDGKTSSYA